MQSIHFLFSDKEQNILALESALSLYADDLPIKEVPYERTFENIANNFDKLNNLLVKELFPDVLDNTKKNKALFEKDLFHDIDKNITEEMFQRYCKAYIVKDNKYEITINIQYNLLRVIIDYKNIYTNDQKEELVEKVEYIRSSITDRLNLITIDCYNEIVIHNGNRLDIKAKEEYQSILREDIDLIIANYNELTKYNWVTYPIFFIHLVLLCYLSFILYSFANQTSSILENLNIDNKYQLTIEEKSIGKYYLDIPPFKPAILDEYFVSGTINNSDFAKLAIPEYHFERKDIGEKINVLKTNYIKEPYITENYYNNMPPYFKYKGKFYSAELLLFILSILALIYYLISILIRNDYIKITQFINHEVKHYAYFTIIPAVILLFCSFTNA